MLIALLVFEIALAMTVFLSTSMLDNKYTEIERSLQLYQNNRAYKTASHIEFIDGVVKRYRECLEDTDEPDLESIIKNRFYKEYIGRFTYIGVKNVASKSSVVMWGMIILEVVIGFINNTSTSLHSIIVVASSVLLTLLVQIFVVVKALEDKKNSLIVDIQDYIYNVYPIQVKKNKEKREVEQLKTKLHQLQKQKESQEQIDVAKAENISNLEEQNKTLEAGKNVKSKKNSQLSAQDIADFIGLFQ